MTRPTHDDCCPICYDLFVESRTLTLENCGHRFCTTCAEEFILQKLVSCPMDRSECTGIFINGTKCHNTLRDYQYGMVNDTKTMDDHMRNTWSYYLPVYSKSIETLLTFKSQSMGLLEQWVSRDLVVSPEEIGEYRGLYNQHNMVMGDFFQLIQTNYDKNKYIKDTILEWSGIWLDPFHEKLFENCRIVFMLSAFFCNDVAESNILDIAQPGKNQNDIMKRTSMDLQSDISSLKSISTYITRLAICEVEDNKELYSMHCKEITGTNENQCLVCAGLTNPLSYSKFSKCNHKICLQCVKDLCLTNGKCPFDGQSLDDLIIPNNNSFEDSNYKTCSQFLVESHGEIFLNKITKMLDFITELVSEISDLKEGLPALMYFEGELRDEKERKVVISYVKKEIKDIRQSRFFKSFVLGKAEMIISKICRGVGNDITLEIVYQFALNCADFCAEYNVFYDYLDNHDMEDDVEELADLLSRIKIMSHDLYHQLKNVFFEFTNHIEQYSSSPCRPLTETIEWIRTKLFQDEL